MKTACSYDSADTEHTDTSTGDGVDDDAEMGIGRDDEQKECPICMEPFSVDDIVSWSPNIDGTCKHVFHHECIKEWMLQSGNCPCCREVLLPIDEEGHSLERPALKELCRKRAKLAATSYYCLEDGLVCFEAPNKTSLEMFAAMKKATACRVARQEVSDRRGHRMFCGLNDKEDEEEVEGDAMGAVRSGGHYPESYPDSSETTEEEGDEDDDDDGADNLRSAAGSRTTTRSAGAQPRLLLQGDGQQLTDQIRLLPSHPLDDHNNRS